MNKDGYIRRALAHAFPVSLPIGVSFIALGMALGIFATSQGLPLWAPVAIAAVVYAGAMEFITVGLLLSSFDPLGAFILTLMVNGRHIFYGVSILERYRHVGWKKWPLMAGLVDESFAVNISVNLPDEVDPSWFYLHITWLLYVYWVLGVALGCFAGIILQDVNMQGIEFVMAALFIVIFLDMMKKHAHNSRFAFGLMGLVVSFLCLALVGAKNFALPAIFLMLVYCFISYKRGGANLDES